jgi:hypothetical protein
MSEIVAEHTALADEEHQQLRLLVSKWQLLADIAFIASKGGPSDAVHHPASSSSSPRGSSRLCRCSEPKPTICVALFASATSTNQRTHVTAL